MDKNEKQYDTRLIVLWTLFIIKLIFGLMMLKTIYHELAYMFCTWAPLMIYLGIQGFKVQWTLEREYLEVLKAHPRLTAINSRPFIRKRDIKDIEDKNLQRELSFLRRSRHLAAIWLCSYALDFFL